MKKIDCLTMGKMVEEMFDGEPVFIIRAHDVVAIPVLEKYLEQAITAGAGNKIRTKAAIDRFKSWQNSHSAEVRKAD